MKTIIIGAGEVGTNIARQLIDEQKDVVIIEKDPETARRLNDTIDCLVMTGEGTNVNSLIDAGIENTDILVAATSVDEVNMVSCLVAASEFKIPIKIARVRNIGYSRSGIGQQSFIGIDYMVNPEIEASNAIVQTVEWGASSSILAFEGTNAQLRSFQIGKGSPFADKDIKDVRQMLKFDFVIAGVRRNKEVIIPSGNFHINEGDIVSIVAIGRSFNKIASLLGRKTQKLKKIIVVGGGLIGTQVTGMLIDKGRDIRLIEKDKNRCREIAALYPEAEITCGDITDEDIFEEENLSSCDAIITTTVNEELNILAGIYAKSEGIKRAVALINKNNYVDLAVSLGIDSCISPKQSSVDAILKFIRRGHIRNVYTIFDGRAEALVFSVSNSSAIAGRAIMDLKFPAQSLIVAVQRQRKTIIPTGKFVIEGGDIVIAFVIDEVRPMFEDMLEL